MQNTSMRVVMENRPTEVANAELLPCPFCGGEAKIRILPEALMIGQCYRAQCRVCGVASTFVSPGKYLKFCGRENVTFTDEEAASEAARIWNTRKKALSHAEPLC